MDVHHYDIWQVDVHKPRRSLSPRAGWPPRLPSQWFSESWSRWLRCLRRLQWLLLLWQISGLYLLFQSWLLHQSGRHPWATWAGDKMIFTWWCWGWAGAAIAKRILWPLWKTYSQFTWWSALPDVDGRWQQLVQLSEASRSRQLLQLKHDDDKEQEEHFAEEEESDVTRPPHPEALSRFWEDATGDHKSCKLKVKTLPWLWQNVKGFVKTVHWGGASY